MVDYILPGEYPIEKREDYPLEEAYEVPEAEWEELAEDRSGYLYEQWKKRQEEDEGEGKEYSRREPPPYMGSKAEREAEKEIQKTKKAQLRAKRAQAESITEDLKKKRREASKARRDEAAKRAGQVAKTFAPASAPGGVKKFYLGGASKDLYTPDRPSAEPLKHAPAGKALRPHTERLRRAVSPGEAVTMPIARMSVPSTTPAQLPEYGFLREMALPSGTSRLEHAVFAEIQANHDVDTAPHIKDEVARLGYRRSDIGGAIKTLVQKGFIEKRDDGAYEVVA